jgi:hypothetical protein
MEISVKLLKGENVNTSDNLYTKRNDFVARDIAGETIIVPIRGHVGDLDSIYTLNEVGTTIWQLIDGKKSVGQIADTLCNTYEVTLEEAKKDTLEFLNSLKEAGLLRLSDL